MQNLNAPASEGLKKKLNTKARERRATFASSTSIMAVIDAPSRRNDLAPKLKFERRPIESFKPARRRLRKPSTKQIERVIRCIKTVGMCVPIVIDGNGQIIDGHLVIEAAKKLAIDALPCVIIEHLSETEVNYLRIALNRISEGGEWDLDELRPMLIELRDDGFVLEDTGFSIPELDIILLEDAQSSIPEPDEEIEPSDDPPVSRVGDVWELGHHRLLCGDSTEAKTYAILLGDEKAHAVFTDAPFNLRINGFVSSKHEDFKMAAGEMSEEQYANFIESFARLCYEFLEDARVMFSCIDWRSFSLVHQQARAVGFELINTTVWNKGSGGMGSLYRSAHEFIQVFCKGKTPRVNNVQLGRHGRDRTNVWSYPGATCRGSSPNEALKDHPTPKSIEMVHDAIIDVTNPGEIVLDPFLGSGTTLIAAEASGRRCRAIELDPAYVDVCIRRWEGATGKQAIHSESGVSFGHLCRTRVDELSAALGEEERS